MRWNFWISIDPGESIQITNQKFSPYMATKNDTIFDTSFFWVPKIQNFKKSYLI
nr:MAG TPA: hypothetical protein [Caudoviricetes sp.]